MSTYMVLTILLNLYISTDLLFTIGFGDLHGWLGTHLTIGTIGLYGGILIIA